MSSYIPIAPKLRGFHVFDDISLEMLVPYIDWRFFFSAWKLSGKYDQINTAICDCGNCETLWLQQFPEAEKTKAKEALQLYKDALHLLQSFCKKKMLLAQGIIGLFAAKSQNEGIIFYHKNQAIYLPTLRQQTANQKGFFLSLCDFISPTEDYAGTFAVTIHGADELAKDFEQQNDSYSALLTKSIADRLAEAAAEWVHEQVRKYYWGYAANENCSIDDMLKIKYSGIRPAIGYPSLPDQSVIFDLQPILPLDKINVILTENGAMQPNASVCGIVIAHPEARYFSVGKISEEQLDDYAKRRKKSAQEMRKWLIGNINQF
jgi:5-methyltetrahydrofolate--homocysteine methyltransferase